MIADQETYHHTAAALKHRGTEDAEGVFISEQRARAAVSRWPISRLLRLGIRASMLKPLRGRSCSCSLTI